MRYDVHHCFGPRPSGWIQQREAPPDSLTPSPACVSQTEREGRAHFLDHADILSSNRLMKRPKAYLINQMQDTTLIHYLHDDRCVQRAVRASAGSNRSCESCPRSATKISENTIGHSEFLQTRVKQLPGIGVVPTQPDAITIIEAWLSPNALCQVLRHRDHLHDPLDLKRRPGSIATKRVSS